MANIYIPRLLVQWNVYSVNMVIRRPSAYGRLCHLYLHGRRIDILAICWMNCSTKHKQDNDWHELEIKCLNYKQGIATYLHLKREDRCVYSKWKNQFSGSSPLLIQVFRIDYNKNSYFFIRWPVSWYWTSTCGTDMTPSFLNCLLIEIAVSWNAICLLNII